MTLNGTRRSRLNLAGFAGMGVIVAVAFAFDLAAGHVAVAAGVLSAALYFAGAGLYLGGGARHKRVKATPVWPGVAKAMPAAVPAGRPKTHAESVAEAVEAQRQRQWDVITERAYLAAGGREPRPAPKVKPAQWLASAADEFMRTGQRPRGLVLPEGVIGAQADVLAGQRKRKREVKLTAWLEDGNVLTESRFGDGAANGLSLGTAFALPGGKPLPGSGTAAGISLQTGTGFGARIAADLAAPRPPAIELDPRWEWKLFQGYGKLDRYVVVRCLHSEVIPVESADGKTVVAQLCLTCDTQFPAPAEP